MVDETEIRKQLSVDALPEVLVLQLSRFAFDFRKNASVKVRETATLTCVRSSLRGQITQEVSYPATLALPERYLSPELAAKVYHSGAPHSVVSAEFELSAVVLHHGEKASNGHYSTLARELPARPTGEDGEQRGSSSVWRSFNDTKVAVLSEQQALSATGMVSAPLPSLFTLHCA